MNKKKIAIIYNTMWYIYNFRLNLLRELLRSGYSVAALAPFDGYETRLQELGVECIDIKFQSRSTNPVSDLKILLEFHRGFKRIKPDCILSFTIKPNIYGSIAARLRKVPIINNITGLGSAFISGNLITRIIIFLYRFALKASKRVFFQNNDDLNQFIGLSIVTREQSRRIPGSGVDLEKYKPLQAEEQDGLFRFLLIGRMLKDKGVCEYVDAARSIRAKGVHAEFGLLGEIDVDNPTTIVKAEIDEWERAGLVRYYGTTNDVRPFIAKSHCIVLPSYREGLSRTLLEAAAMGKPCIAADVPGCRDVVENGKTGFLCEVKNALDLSNQMERMIALSEIERSEMGKQGRKKIENEFDDKIVIKAYSEEIENILNEATRTN
jgi:glycosyltransferase involved in cell wall biosynthesis